MEDVSEHGRIWLPHTWHSINMFTELALDRLTLQSLEKGPNENFKDYARRWRETAMEVQPPLTERELTTLFINTLKGVYYEKLIGHVSSTFADLVASGELIESGVKGGKLKGEMVEAPKRSPIPPKKKEGETNFVYQSGPMMQPNPPQMPVYFRPPPVAAYVVPAPIPQFQPFQFQARPRYTYPAP